MHYLYNSTANPLPPHLDKKHIRSYVTLYVYILSSQPNACNEQKYRFGKRAFLFILHTFPVEFGWVDGREIDIIEAADIDHHRRLAFAIGAAAE